LNQKIGAAEQSADPTAKDGVALAAAKKFFEANLSHQLIFRRAGGKVVGKSAFLDSLEKNPFQSLQSEQVAVELMGDRSLVTLIVVGTMQDQSVHRYRNIRLFSRVGDSWHLELWYNYEITGL
jgi:hypothetical protein